MRAVTPPWSRRTWVTVCVGAVTLLAAPTVISAKVLSTASNTTAVRANARVSTTNSSSALPKTRAPVGTTAPTRPEPTMSRARIRASTPRNSTSDPPWKVARTTRTYTDGARSTPARGIEPGHSGRVMRTIIRWPVTRRGVLAPGRHPLVVFAHGYAVETSTYSGLLDDLAAAGMIVAAPELPGESAALAGPPNETDLANEPCDLEFVADSVEHEPPAGLAGALARAPLVFAGHSDGATAAAAAGYSTNNCPGPKPVVVVALSSDDVVVKDAARGSLPTLLAATGTADEINPVSHTETLWLHVPRPAWLLTVQGGTHLGTFTTDPDRPQVDAVIITFVLAHTVDPLAAANTFVNGRLHLYER